MHVPLRDNRRSLRASRRGAHIRQGARRRRRNDPAAAAARRRAARPRPPRHRSPGSVPAASSGSLSRSPSYSFSTVTMVFCAACAIATSSRCVPIKTLPARSAIGAWNSATSGLSAGSSTIGSLLPNGLSMIFQSGRCASTSEPMRPAQRHERHALLGGLELRMQRRAGGVHHADRAGEDRRREARRRAEFAEADRGRFQRLDAAGADQQVRLQGRCRQRDQMQSLDAAPDQRARRRHGDARRFTRHRQHAAVGDGRERFLERAGDHGHETYHRPTANSACSLSPRAGRGLGVRRPSARLRIAATPPHPPSLRSVDLSPHAGRGEAVRRRSPTTAPP